MQTTGHKAYDQQRQEEYFLAHATGGPWRSPPATRLMTSNTRKMKNKILAMPAQPRTPRRKPKKAAINAIIRKTSAQYNIAISLFRKIGPRMSRLVQPADIENSIYHAKSPLDENVVRFDARFVGRGDFASCNTTAAFVFKASK